ncbi:phist protein [Plasmodium cynomolgi strain B]|uniref:Phist protein n=1 Tax=Plasmodium cynomolgi (strain B) TaxID=1120755 RepID=K6V7K5_PLACD|nr:phist protein [Plasmodium cynomolgi strain B]GAB65092.1 phist protein [Plasmodium cynomolgi strain B]
MNALLLVILCVVLKNEYTYENEAELRTNASRQLSEMRGYPNESRNRKPTRNERYDFPDEQFNRMHEGGMPPRGREPRGQMSPHEEWDVERGSQSGRNREMDMGMQRDMEHDRRRGRNRDDADEEMDMERGDRRRRNRNRDEGDEEMDMERGDRRRNRNRDEGDEEMDMERGDRRRNRNRGGMDEEMERDNRRRRGKGRDMDREDSGDMDEEGREMFRGRGRDEMFRGRDRDEMGRRRDRDEMGRRRDRDERGRGRERGREEMNEENEEDPEMRRELGREVGRIMSRGSIDREMERKRRGKGRDMDEEEDRDRRRGKGRDMDEEEDRDRRRGKGKDMNEEEDKDKKKGKGKDMDMENDMNKKPNENKDMPANTDGKGLDLSNIADIKFHVTEAEIAQMIDKLKDYVKFDEMFLLFNFVNNNEKIKYVKMQLGVVKLCETLAQTYKIPHYYKTRQWSKSYQGMSDQLLHNERKAYNKLCTFLQNGNSSHIAFIEFLNELIGIWTSFTKEMEKYWKEYLTNKFKLYWETTNVEM